MCAILSEPQFLGAVNLRRAFRSDTSQLPYLLPSTIGPRRRLFHLALRAEFHFSQDM